MFKRHEKDVLGQIDTLIGRSAKVQGDVEFAGGLHVDGRITGNVRATAGVPASLSVSEHGVVEGSVEAQNVVLNGRINGDIFGSGRVVLGAKARALLNARTHVSAEDIRTLAAPVLRHRILVNYRAEAEGTNVDTVIRRLLETVGEPGAT